MTITVHTFRHTLATEMFRHGADLRKILVIERDFVPNALMRTASVVMRCDLIDDVFEMRLRDSSSR